MSTNLYLIITKGKHYLFLYCQKANSDEDAERAVKSRIGKSEKIILTTTVDELESGCDYIELSDLVL